MVTKWNGANGKCRPDLLQGWVLPIWCILGLQGLKSILDWGQSMPCWCCDIPALLILDVRWGKIAEEMRHLILKLVLNWNSGKGVLQRSAGMRQWECRFAGRGNLVFCELEGELFEGRMFVARKEHNRNYKWKMAGQKWRYLVARSESRRINLERCGAKRGEKHDGNEGMNLFFVIEYLRITPNTYWWLSKVLSIGLLKIDSII